MGLYILRLLSVKQIYLTCGLCPVCLVICGTLAFVQTTTIFGQKTFVWTSGNELFSVWLYCVLINCVQSIVSAFLAMLPLSKNYCATPVRLCRPVFDCLKYGSILCPFFPLSDIGGYFRYPNTRSMCGIGKSLRLPPPSQFLKTTDIHSFFVFHCFSRPRLIWYPLPRFLQ